MRRGLMHTTRRSRRRITGGEGLHYRRLLCEPLEDRRLLSVNPFPVPLQAVFPLGSLVYESSVGAEIGASGETDGFTVAVDDGQTITVVVDPEAMLRPTIELRDPGDAVIGTAHAAAVGQDTVLQTVATTGAGMYTVMIGGAAESIGEYSVELILNAAVEEEAHDGQTNDEAAAAQDIDASFLSLGVGSAGRAAVVGTADASEDWYAFSLDDGQSATLALTSLTFGSGTLELYDAGQTLLAVGNDSATNVAQVIDDFVDLTSDEAPATYYARVFNHDSNYSLMVTRGAGFDLEPNNGPPDPLQEIARNGTVLGSLHGMEAVWVQKLTASDAYSDDGFGLSVSISGDTMIVGAFQNDDGGTSSGSAYIFRDNGNEWLEQQKLTASDAAAGDHFGYSVAISGDTAIVGAHINGDAGYGSGSAYIFHYDGSQWIEQQKLTASDAYGYDEFGISVAISGDTAIVGAYGNDDAGSFSGSAYIFHYNGSQWVEQQKLTAYDADAEDRFGNSVSISGDTAIVGAYGNDDDGMNSGSAYIFHYDGSQWAEQQKLTASDADSHDYFGNSVSISGDTMIVGAFFDDNAETDSGSAYIFHRNGSQWAEQWKLTASDAGAGDYFGNSVSISGDTAIVGASCDDNAEMDSGSAYIFHRNGSQWAEQGKLTASDADSQDHFGDSVSISGSTAIVGAHCNDDAGSNSGSAYLFARARDGFSVSVLEGDAVEITVTTPADGPGEFVNDLEPVVELYDETGALVADTWGGPASLMYTTTSSGTYAIRVLMANAIAGEYVLHVDGTTGPTGTFEVTGVDPADQAVIIECPIHATLDFNDVLLRSTIDASDLTIDGLPATSVVVVDHDTLAFDLPSLSEGPHDLAIAAGALLDIHGTPIEPFSSQFVLDTTPPRVVASSILEGDLLVLTGNLVYAVQFDELLRQSNLDASDVSLVGQLTGTHALSTFQYDVESSTLTLEFADPPDDHYTLTLTSGDESFEDVVGHDLDGEPHPTTTVPSGDSVEGGDFVVRFTLDNRTPVAFTTPAKPVVPLGSLIHRVDAGGKIDWEGERDVWSLVVDDGQTITVVVDPEATLRPTIELRDPGDAVIGTAQAAAEGQDAVLQTVATTGTGTYTVMIGGAADSADEFSVELILNAAVEAEAHDGPANDEAAAAQDIDSSFLSLGVGSAARAAIVGTADASEDWYAFSLEDGQSATLALTNLTSGSGTLEFYDAGQTLLAVGHDGATNVDQVIYDFIDLTSDEAPATYYVRVFNHNSDYSLVVTRDAGFDLEPNDGPTDPLQELARNGTMLGSLHGVEAALGQKLTASDASYNDCFGRNVSVSGDTVIVGAYYDDDGGLSSGSAYIFHCNGSEWVEQQKLTASDAASGDYFGYSIAISGDTVIVGAYGNNDGGTDSGSAYIFHYNGSRWVEQQKLTASDAHYDDYFGYSVAISGDTAIVGAYVNDDAGSAYVFHYDGSQWVEQQKLTASDATVYDHFGYSISISGDTAIVGAYGNDDAGAYSGSAYIFHRDGSQWVEQQKLTASDAGGQDYFGYSVSISGDTAIVGAYENDDAGRDSGSAYVFHRDGSQWVEQQKLTASDADSYDRFGNSVSISDDTTIVGAYSDDDAGNNSGSAYIFHYDGSQWVEQRKLTAFDADSDDYFGRSVSISGSTAIVGAPCNDGAGWHSGSAYLFAPAHDGFSVNVLEDDAIEIVAATLAAGPGEFVNDLEPAIELFDETGTLVADTRGGPPSLMYTATSSGTYAIHVLMANAIEGEYVLHVNGTTGPTGTFEVTGVDPADQAVMIECPVHVTLDFKDTLLLSTVDAADLTIDGLPATAVVAVDHDTLVFDLPSLADGPHDLAIAAGDLLDIQGTSIEPFSSQFILDLTPPRVAASSILEGDLLVLTGSLIYTAQFDELLRQSSLDASDVSLVGQATGTHTPSTFQYDAESSTLTLEFANLTDDQYTLTLISGDESFEDVVGHDLDGEPHPTTTVPSGDGMNGGDFVVHFVLDNRDPTAFTTPAEAIAPLGSLIHHVEASDQIDWESDVDVRSLAVDDGQTITVVIDPEATLRPTIELRDPGDVLIGTAQSAVAGQDVVLQAVATTGAGTYTVTIGGMDDSTGEYSVELILNAVVEEEAHDGPANDEAAASQDIGSSFLSLGVGSASRAAVVGTADTSEDWYAFSLDDGQSATLALTSLTFGSGTLELYDAGQTLLAVGSDGAANVDQVIHDFVDQTSDEAATIYYARVFNHDSDYSLIVTRDAGFDLEPNDGPPGAFQELAHSGTVLGSLRVAQKLTASDANGGDYFGGSVSISGDMAIVGARQDDDAGSNSGSAYIFHYDGSQWVEQQKLTASDAADYDHFGDSVSISGDTAIVGARQDDDAGSDSGSAYIFHYDGSQWAEQQKLTASDAAGSDYFGSRVSISGDTAIVGAYGNDDAGSYSGSAYIFHYDGSQWVEQQKLTASDAASSDYFGISVSISGDTAIVGARGNDDAGSSSGSAYIFSYDGSQWVEQQKLTASDANGGDYFGNSVSIDGDTAIVGAYKNDDAGTYSGSAYIFHYDGSQWVEQQKLTASDANSYDYFGNSVSISGDTAIIGAYKNDDAGTYSGSAYIFHRDGGTWSEQRKLAASDAGLGDYFGSSVSVSGDTTIVGAYGNNDDGMDSGSAYLFAPARDGFSVNVLEGDAVEITVTTPADGPGEPVNELEPAIELFDETGTLVADTRGGPASLVHTATSSGAYTVNVFGANWTTGEYVLHVELRLPGDANRDRIVNDQDASILAAHWQMPSGATWADGDFNGDGIVNDQDASILASHWQTGVEEGESAAPVESKEAAKPERARTEPVAEPAKKQDRVRTPDDKPSREAAELPLRAIQERKPALKKPRVPDRLESRLAADDPPAAVLEESVSVGVPANPIVTENLSRRRLLVRDAVLAEEFARREARWEQIAWLREFDRTSFGESSSSKDVLARRAVDHVLMKYGI